MAPNKNHEFLRTAMSLKMISPCIFNEVADEMEVNPALDAGRYLVEKKILTEEQYKAILSDTTFDMPPDETEYTDDFILRGLVGRGGLGRVWLAYDKNLRREVAIKEVVPEKLGDNYEKYTKSLVKEAEITGQLEHPGVVPVYQLEKKEDGSFFYVMRYVHGRTFKDVLDESRQLPPDAGFIYRMRFLASLIDVADAVGYAHSKMIVHRDLKPANIVIGEYGETVILDWGLAKCSNECVDPNKVEPPTGTPSYMAPEQIDKKWGGIETSTDVYALGVLLYILLTGEKPYRGSSKDVMSEIVSTGSSPMPKKINPSIPPELDAICRKAMSKEQKFRFKDANAMAEELKAFRDGRLVSVYAYSRGELFKRFVQKNKIGVIATMVMIFSILGGAGFTLHYAISAHQAHMAAEKALVDLPKLAEEGLTLARQSAFNLNRFLREHPEDVNDLASHVPEAIAFDPMQSPYQIWIMDEQGVIVYDENTKEIGLNLFSDEMYKGFPELLQIGKRIKNEPWGIGHYRFFLRGSEKPIYKLAAWDTVTLKNGMELNVVVVYPYVMK